MDTVKVLQLDKARQASGYYDSGVGALLLSKWSGRFNGLSLPVQQAILDYAEAVAIEHAEQTSDKVVSFSSPHPSGCRCPVCH